MRKLGNLLWRSLLIALIYTAANALIGGLVMRGATTSSTTSMDPALLLATTFISGFLLAIILGAVAPLVYAKRIRAVGTWTVLIFLNMASVVIEGYFFAPGLLPLSLVPRVLVLHAFSSVIIAAAIAYFFPCNSETPKRIQPIKRSALSWTGRFLASAASYLVFYYVFGAINYALITGPYYQTHTGLQVPAAQTVILVASFRSVIIILSLLPLITALQLPKGKRALLCGFLLFVIGGVLPLATQTSVLPPILLLASGVEIFFQNFLTGAVAALLLGRPGTPPAPLQVVPAEVLEHHA